jgi:hypothetical protein
MATWIVEEDVLAELGLEAGDDVLTRRIAAAAATVQVWRSDITDFSTVRVAHPNVYDAGVQLAALMYQEKVTPEGFAGFNEAGGLLNPSNAKMVSIRHLARANRPKVG